MALTHLSHEALLQSHGLRRTQGRIALLEELAAAQSPRSIDDLLQKLSVHMDQASLYRALEAFKDEGIVASYDFGHGHGHYELITNKPHHHHAVCENCGMIEDIPALDTPQVTKHALSAATQFKNFNRHSLEFYGTCTNCA